MIRITPDELSRWRAEIDLGVEFRDKEFGTYRQQQPGAAPKTSLAGKNLDYFEQGGREDEAVGPPLNLVFPIVKNVVPTLFFQNPKVMAQPEQSEGVMADDAFYVGQLINRDLRDTDMRIKETAQTATFDGYVLSVGLVKIGYATKFGQDILPTERERKKKLLDRMKEQVVEMAKAIVGQPTPPKPVEPEQVQVEESIQQEAAYIQYVDPFDFVIDPYARDIYSARWVAQRIRRTLGEIKRDRRYGQAKHELTAEPLDDDRIQESFIEEFQTVDIWEVHYKDADAPTGIRLLAFAATQTQTKALIHEDNECDIGGWQFEGMFMNKHGHRLYPISTISVIRPLIDRINSSLDAILEQVDKFQSKLAYNDRVSPDGKMALESGQLGALVHIEGQDSAVGAIVPIGMEQVKADLLGLINHVIDFVILITGLTRAQLTGQMTAQTATEAQIGQSGQNLRRTDEANVVGDWFKRVITKYWRIKAQFCDLANMKLVKETGVPDAATGMTQTQWYPAIDEARAERLKRTRFGFDLEAFSMQKPNLEIVRAQLAEFIRALMEPIVTQGLALEGKRVSASESIRQWSRVFTEAGMPGLEKIIVPINDPMMAQALLNYGQTPTQATGPGTSQMNGKAPNHADLISAAAGEKGQGRAPA